MKIIYDPDTDTLSLILREQSVAESDELKEGLVVDYDTEGKITSIEILDASKHITEPQAIAYELKARQRVS